MDINCPQCGKTYFNVGTSLIGRFMRCNSCQTKFKIEDPNQLKGSELRDDVYDLLEPVAPKVEKTVPPVISSSSDTVKVKPPVLGSQNQAVPPILPGSSKGLTRNKGEARQEYNSKKSDEKHHSYAAKAPKDSDNDQDHDDVKTTWRPSVLTIGLFLFFLVFSISIISVVRSKVVFPTKSRH